MKRLITILLQIWIIIILTIPLVALCAGSVYLGISAYKDYRNKLPLEEKNYSDQGWVTERPSIKQDTFYVPNARKFMWVEGTNTGELFVYPHFLNPQEAEREYIVQKCLNENGLIYAATPPEEFRSLRVKYINKLPLVKEAVKRGLVDDVCTSLKNQP